MFHPATLLLAWAGLAVAQAFLDPRDLALLLGVAVLAAFIVAPARFRQMLKRARWLLASIAFLFAFSTPGLMVPGFVGELGVTQDGVALAAEHVARLTLLLATLALLHEYLGTAGIVAGLYWLGAPLARIAGLRERIVVRLILVLDLIESDARRSGWRDWLEAGGDAGPSVLQLEIRAIGWRDRLAMGAMMLACGMLIAW